MSSRATNQHHSTRTSHPSCEPHQSARGVKKQQTLTLINVSALPTYPASTGVPHVHRTKKPSRNLTLSCRSSCYSTAHEGGGGCLYRSIYVRNLPPHSHSCFFVSGANRIYCCSMINLYALCDRHFTVIVAIGPVSLASYRCQ